MRKNLLKVLGILMCFTIMVVVNVQAAETVTTDKTGYHDGYYYMFWSDYVGPVTMTLGAGGNYSVDWSNCGNFVCGKGWYPGEARTISYTGSFNVNGNGYLAVYGWTVNPLVEYYVVENYGSWMPPGGTLVGTIVTDGGTYNLYRTQRINQPSIIGYNTFYTYWSVRTSKRSSGTVTLRNHFDAWKSKGWNMGTYHYQIVATEGYQSSGSSNITVLTAPNPTPTPTQPVSPTATLMPTPTQSVDPTATPTPTRAATPTPTMNGNYVVSYVIQSSWGTGGTVSVSIKNNTTSAVNGWTFVFTLPSGTTISNLWSGSYTQSGTTVTVKNASWNANIPANGGSVNFGFNYNGSNGAGSGFTLNGVACSQ